MIVALLVAVIAIAIVAALFWTKYAKHRATLQAAIAAQLARESDELDLDRRLGKKTIVPVESSLYPNIAKLEIAFRQTGNGPDLLCLHGIGASMMIYRRLVPWLANDYRITCLDFPGFGASSKPRQLNYSLDEQTSHLEQTVLALGLKRPLVIASSMGGAIALNTARLTASLFRGIVALAPAVDPKRIPSVLIPLAKFSDRLHRVHSLPTVRAALSQVIGRRELITPALVALYQEPFLDAGDSSSAFMKAFKLIADKRLPRIFAEISTPLLIVRGLRDRLVKQAACEDLHRLVSGSSLITHPTAGHHIMEDEPEFLAYEIRKFDASLEKT